MNPRPDPGPTGAPSASGRRVFVAGGTGVIGSRAVARLVAAGHQVTVLVRSPEKAATVRAWGAEPVEAGLFDPPTLAAAVAGHDVVCNLATHIPRSSRAALARSWAVNDRIRREGSANLVDAALAAGARVFVQESLAFAYRDGGARWLDEDSPLELAPPVDSVSVAEASAARFTAAGSTGVVLRFGAFVAADGHLTRDLVALARRGMSAIMGAPGAYKASIHADDAALGSSGRAGCGRRRVQRGRRRALHQGPTGGRAGRTGGPPAGCGGWPSGSGPWGEWERRCWPAASG